MRLLGFGIPLLTFLLVPDPATAQSFLVQGAAGPTAVDRGYSVAAGAGLSLNPWVTVLGDLERTHLETRIGSNERGGGSAFRGGTVTYGSAEVRVSLLGRTRVSPYVLGGFAAGVSRPTVNERYPDSGTNNVRATFFGGGIQVPVRERLTMFADGRVLIGAEAGETLALAPIRFGIGWRF